MNLSEATHAAITTLAHLLMNEQPGATVVVTWTKRGEPIGQVSISESGTLVVSAPNTDGWSDGDAGDDAPSEATPSEATPSKATPSEATPETEYALHDRVQRRIGLGWVDSFVTGMALYIDKPTEYLCESVDPQDRNSADWVPAGRLRFGASRVGAGDIRTESVLATLQPASIESGGFIGELAAAAEKHGCSVTISAYPPSVDSEPAES